MRRVKIPTVYDDERELLQLEMDARHAKVLELHSRGMTQVEIAQHMRFSQSLISKDLGRIGTKVKNRMRDLVSDDLWEYGKNMSGQDAAIKKLWEIAEDKGASARSRVQAQALILEFYDAQGKETLLASKAFKAANSDKDEGIYGR